MFLSIVEASIIFSLLLKFAPRKRLRNQFVFLVYVLTRKVLTTAPQERVPERLNTSHQEEVCG